MIDFFCVFLCLSFVSLSVYRGCWRTMYVVPIIAQHTNGMGLCCCCLQLCCLCRSFVTTAFASPGRRISADTGRAGCQWVEITVYCEAHTYTAAPLQTPPGAPVTVTVVTSFFSRSIDGLFHKNIIAKSDFSVSASFSVNHMETPCGQVCAKFRDHRGGNKLTSLDQQTDFSTLSLHYLLGDTIR